MSKFSDALRGLYFRRSKQANIENALARVEASLERVDIKPNLDRVEEKLAASDNVLTGIDNKIDNRLADIDNKIQTLLSTPTLQQSADTSVLNDHLVAKFVTILTHIHSNNEIVRGLNTPDYIWRQLNSFNALAQIYGQLNSMEHKASIDGNGRPIPWYTYPAIEYLSNLDLTQKRVFEYGSGNSSLWWANRCHDIVAIESDRRWYEKVNSSRSGGQFRDYRLREDIDSYVQHDDIGEFNVIIIDGTFRTCCAGFFLSKVPEPNNFEILIYDNADWQPDVIRILNQKLPGWVQVDFHGFAPINDFTSTTTIFINANVKQSYAKDISSMYSSPHGGGSVSGFKDNYYVREYLLK